MKRYIILILAMVFAGVTLQAQSYKVVVNSENPVSSVSSAKLSKYFLKKSAKWDNGNKVIPVDLSSKSDVRSQFSKAVHGKSVGSIKSYWQQYVFAGKGTPPVEKKSDAEVIEYVKRNPGAIGYVSAGADVSGVNVLSIN